MATLTRNWSVPRVGLTGGIASGKSLVSDGFAACGVPVIDSDLLSRELVRPGSPALAEIRAAFGPEVLTAAGELDRSALRDRAFRNTADQRRLEAILHPRILAALEAAAASSGGPYQILVVPLLFESGFHERVDRILIVDCPESLQRSRLAFRDGASPAAVERMLAAQLSRDARLARAREFPHDVVDNSGSADETRRQVAELHRRYLKQFAPDLPAGAE